MDDSTCEALLFGPGMDNVSAVRKVPGQYIMICLIGSFDFEAADSVSDMTRRLAKRMPCLRE